MSTQTLIQLDLDAREITLLALMAEEAETGYLHNPSYPTERAKRIVRLLRRITLRLPSQITKEDK